MSVINVDPNSGVHLPANTVPGLMHVYCVGPANATFGISIVNAPPPYTWHTLAAGHTLSFQVDNFPVWVFNQGPSKIQLLFGTPLDGSEIEGEIKGAKVLSSIGT